MKLQLAKLIRFNHDPDSTRFLIYSRIFVYSLVVFTGGSVLWLFTATTEQTVQVTGYLAPKGNIIPVKLANAGVIQQVLVKEGDWVEKDQLLLKLESDLEFKDEEIVEKQIQIKKLQLKQKDSQYHYSQASLEKQLLKIMNLLASESKKYDILKMLGESGAISQFQVLDQQLRVNGLKHDLSIQSEQKALQLALLKSEISQVRQELFDLNKQLSRIKQNIKYLSVSSPSSGYVFDLLVTNSGYVGNSTEDVMKIVPANHLVADINIPADKIGFIKMDAEVDIAIDAFPSSDYGTVPGKISKISTSSLPADNTYPYARYPSQVTLSTQRLKISRDKYLKLKPGMSIAANIKLRKATYFQLIFSQFDKSVKSLTQS